MSSYRRQSLNTLSRLKGIETLHRAIVRFATDNALNTLSRLKGIETGYSLYGRKTVLPLNTLSRLKGIETNYL